jgi:FkbM family methyltransferase
MDPLNGMPLFQHINSQEHGLLNNPFDIQQTDQPNQHLHFLHFLKQKGIIPNCIYDIGAGQLNWTNTAKIVWPNANIVLFDANKDLEYLYLQSKLNYHIDLLSDSQKLLKYYFNKQLPAGNSYYRENNEQIFPNNQFSLLQSTTLDNLVQIYKLPLPQIVNIDTQGSELDIIKGGFLTLQHTPFLIIKAQSTNYNCNAPFDQHVIHFLKQLGWNSIAPKFIDNGPDAFFFLAKKDVNF